MYKAKPDYTFAGCASSASVPTEPGTCYAVTPQDNYTIYNLNPLFTAGSRDAGQTIALIEDTDTYNGTGDWTSYRNAFGLSTAYPSGTYTQVHPGGCADPGTNADDGEAAIDVEVATAFAPNAAIELISCASSTVTFGGLIALQNLINGAGLSAAIVSVSYGECEAINGNGGNRPSTTPFSRRPPRASRFSAHPAMKARPVAPPTSPTVCRPNITLPASALADGPKRRSTLPSVEPISRTSITPTRGETP
jgi:hypothetical protein